MKSILLVIALEITLHSQSQIYGKQDYGCGLATEIDKNYIDINSNILPLSYLELSYINYDNYSDTITTYVPYNFYDTEDFEEINQPLYQSIFYSYKP